MGFYEQLRLRPIINASGTITTLGGSLMEPEVVKAMADASRAFIDMNELHAAAGRRIAGLLGVAAAHVCACASAGITLMAASCMTGTDAAAIDRLPLTEGLRHSFVVQRPHRSGFDRALLVAGGRFVTVEPTRAAVEAAVDDSTAGFSRPSHGCATVRRCRFLSCARSRMPAGFR